MENFTNKKVALVTGGTKGIGKAISKKLSDSEIQVVVISRNDVTESVKDHYHIKADLTQPESSSLIASEILNKFGRIDIIINNAGANLSPGGGFSTISDSDWLNDWQTNFMSAVRINKELLPFMISQKNGVIINISTGAAKQPIWEMTMSYSAAKAALNTYSKALANELAPKGIRVNVVSPGIVTTPLMVDFIENFADSTDSTFEDALKTVIEKVNVPLARMADPEEIANLISFLVSDDAKYITGSNYTIDGGAAPSVS